jgi:hypothetical protein
MGHQVFLLSCDERDRGLLMSFSRSGVNALVLLSISLATHNIPSFCLLISADMLGEISTE